MMGDFDIYDGNAMRLGGPTCLIGRLCREGCQDGAAPTRQEYSITNMRAIECILIYTQ